MRFYSHIRRFVSFSLVTFLLVSIGLGILCVVFLKDLLSHWGGPAFAALAIVLMAIFMTLLGFSLFHVLLHLTRKRDHHPPLINYWLLQFGALVWNQQPLLREPSPHNLHAALALLSLYESLEGPEAEQFQALYKKQGFLAEDLRILQKSRSIYQRSHALVRLGRICHPDAIETLQKELEHPTNPLRQLAFLALVKTHGQIYCSEEALIARLDPLFQEGGFSKGTLEEALTLMGQKAAPLLHHLLQDHQPHLLIQISLNIIGRSGQLDWLEGCLPYLQSEDPELRAAALRALAHLQYVPDCATERVVASLRDPVWFVRTQAAHACIGIADDCINQNLLEALGDPTWWVRHSAADSLAKRGPKGREALEWAVKFHSDPYARDISLQTLV